MLINQQVQILSTKKEHSTILYLVNFTPEVRLAIELLYCTVLRRHFGSKYTQSFSGQVSYCSRANKNIRRRALYMYFHHQLFFGAYGIVVLYEGGILVLNLYSFWGYSIVLLTFQTKNTSWSSIHVCSSPAVFWCIWRCCTVLRKRFWF